MLRLVAQSCTTLCDPMDCSLPGSPIHGILQARILEWVAISFSRGSSQPRDQTQVSQIAGRLYPLSHQRIPDGKESACNTGDPGLIPGLGRSPGGEEWQPTPVFLSGEAHGQRSLAGYGP